MTTSTSSSSASSSSARLSSRAAPFVMDAEPKHAAKSPQPPDQQQAEEEAVEEKVEPPAPAPAAKVPPQQRKKKAAAKAAAAAAAAAAALSLDASAGQLLTGQVQLPAVRATTPCVVRMLLGKQAAAHVIGHRGGAIESVRHAAAAALQENGGECSLPFLLDLDEVRPMHTRRIATLQGALVQVQRALECMLDVLMEKRALGAASAAAAKLAALAPGDRPPPVKQPSDQVAITFIIPNTQLGAVIGMGGSTIAMVRERSAAILRVSEENLERSQEKSLQIVGQRTAVQYAACAVAELLCQAQLAGLPASPQPYVLEPLVRPGQQAALAALATPVPPQPHPNGQQASSQQQQQQPQKQNQQKQQQPSQPSQPHQQPSSMPSMQPILQPLAPPPPHPHPHPPVLMPMPMPMPPHPHAHPMSFNPVVAQLHEVTLRLQQLGIQSAHQSLYGMVNNRQLHANQIEMQQLQHVYSMLQAQLHQQSAAAAAAAMAQMPPQMLPPHLQQSMGIPPGPSPFFRAPAGALGASLDRAQAAWSVRNPVVLSLSIPASLMGGLIGKKGERIQSIRVASEARIKIDSAAESAQRIAEEAAAGAQSTAARANTTTQRPQQQQGQQRPASVAPLPPPSPSPSDDGDRKEREEEAPHGAPVVVAVVAADNARSSPPPPAAGDRSASKHPPSTATGTAPPKSVSSLADRVLTLTGTQRQVELASQLIMESIESLQRGGSHMVSQRHHMQLNTAPQQQPQQKQHVEEKRQQQQPQAPQQQVQQEQQPQPQLPGPVSNVNPVSSR